MPQLDYFLFLSIAVAVFIYFSVIYIIFCGVFFPFLFKNLFLRKFKILFYNYLNIFMGVQSKKFYYFFLFYYELMHNLFYTFLKII